MLAVIAHHNPDITVIAEAKSWSAEEGVLGSEVEHRLNRRLLLAPASSGLHVAVLLRPEWTVHRMEKESQAFHNAMIRVLLECRDGHTLAVLGTHLSPKGGQARVGEAHTLAAKACGADYVVVAGDFNGFDHHGDYLERIHALPENMQSLHLIPGATDRVDSRASRIMEEAGLVDVGFLLNSASKSIVPTALPESQTGFQFRCDWTTSGLIQRWRPWPLGIGSTPLH